jgi:NTP pyrophosphatase (non-canonical NTP hydrolase)
MMVCSGAGIEKSFFDGRNILTGIRVPKFNMDLTKLNKLVITMEECGELIRACSKVMRHGVEDPKYLSNLIDEMGDVRAMISVLARAYELDQSKIEDATQKRLAKMKRPDYS